MAEPVHAVQTPVGQSTNMIFKGYTSTEFQTEVECSNCFCKWILKESDIKCILSGFGKSKGSTEFSGQLKQSTDGKVLFHEADKWGLYATSYPQIKYFIVCPNSECNQIQSACRLPPVVKSRITIKDNMYIIDDTSSFRKVYPTMKHNEFCIANVTIKLLSNNRFAGLAFITPEKYPNFRNVVFIRLPSEIAFKSNDIHIFEKYYATQSNQCSVTQSNQSTNGSNSNQSSCEIM